MPITAIEHVQLAMPPGMEQAARDFYQLEGYLRVFVSDPFGNRIELMEPRRGA